MTDSEMPKETTDMRLAAMEAKMDQILDIMENIQTNIGKAIDQVKPTLDELMKSPIVKMFGLNKKKDQG